MVNDIIGSFISYYFISTIKGIDSEWIENIKKYNDINTLKTDVERFVSENNNIVKIYIDDKDNEIKLSKITSYIKNVNKFCVIITKSKSDKFSNFTYTINIFMCDNYE